METAALIGLCALGTVFPLVNPELLTAAFAVRTGWNPLAVGAITAFGQCITYALVQALGGRILPRWPALQRRVEAVRTRYGAHLERNYLLVAIPGAIVGLPPPGALAVLAPGFEIPVYHLLPVLFVGRTIRMAAVAAFGRGIFDWWNG